MDILDEEEHILLSANKLVELNSSPDINLTNYAKFSILNNFILNEWYELLNISYNQLNNILFNLKHNCTDSTFEFKICTFLLSVLFVIFVGIVICWRFFGVNITHFYNHQGTSSFKFLFYC